ncbi:hypothetical protein TSUD_244290 [Trifolium subterraneum]|uniref:Aminotransferase-like plant mobile domain-containing protein n=1 Tax=Trifolium subterraneum TaxID=3900 RepID=A0A2Z6PNS1_TRISU|nr:hypothetical protein TSUD_244290 [Trifolium subterraneum]
MVKYLGSSPTVADSEDYAIKTYMSVVGTTIFSSKAKSYVDFTYLMYLRDIELVNMYAWGPCNTVIPLHGAEQRHRP